MAKSRDWTEILIRRGVVGPDQLKEAQRMGNVPVEEALVKLGYADADDIMKAKAEQHGMAFVELREIEIPASVVELVPESLARENIVMPLSQENGAIKVIMHDPMDFETIDKLRFVLNREIEVALAPKEAIVEAINRYYGGTSTGDRVGRLDAPGVHRHRDRLRRGRRTGGQVGAATNTLEEGDAPVIRLVHLIIQEAVNMRASRHPHRAVRRPGPDPLPDRRRLHGARLAPRRLLGSIVSRLKIMGSIDIAEKRRPQDGRIKILVAGKDIDLRVSILPTSAWPVGRHADPRPRQHQGRAPATSGSATRTGSGSRRLIKRPNGILLVTGPTGSGKTTTLYAALNELNRPDVKIITAEDPVEYYLPGRQPVRGQGQDRDDLRTHHPGHAPAESRTSSWSAKSAMRRRPKTAIQASLTGHLVFSTLHTNDAPSAITRLVDIGVQPFLVASSVMAIMAQRLVRKVCPKCKVAVRAARPHPARRSASVRRSPRRPTS